MKSKASLFTTLFAVWLVISYIVALWTDRNLDWLVSAIKGSPVDVPMWLSWLVTFVFNAVIFGANIIAEVVRLVI